MSYDRCVGACVHAATLERLDVVAAPAPYQVASLQAVLSALRATQKAIEDSQTATFGAEVMQWLRNPQQTDSATIVLLVTACWRNTIFCGRSGSAWQEARLQQARFGGGQLSPLQTMWHD
jgi:hypothetical protein